MEKRFQIFISSTYIDLIKERDKVIQAVLELNHFPSGMELFPAVGIPPKDVIEKYLKGCDYYLLIIAGRYGSLTREGISYTEWEYNIALKCGLPVIAFLHGDTKSIPSGKTDEKSYLRKKLLAFREKVENGNHTVKYWSNADELKAQVLSSIPWAIKFQPQIGWVRGNNVASDDAQKEINKLKNNIEQYKNTVESLEADLKDFHNLKLTYEEAKREISKLKALVNKQSQSIIITIPGTNVSFKMIKVEGGTFMMGATPEQKGDAYSDESPIHEVMLSDFSIGEMQVTQELWEAVMGFNPSWFNGNKLPVENVSWDDCQEFIRKLNEKTKRNFRLPTEAEWEYAARGGNKSQGYKYAGSDNLDDVAWFHVNSYDKTHDVGQKKPNELGLYDMSGNVWEWCNDWYDDYSNSSQNNPQGPSSGSNRVRRGGSWCSDARICRVSIRYYCTPDYRNGYLGLRLAQ